MSRGDSITSDTVSIALEEPADSTHAPIPHNDAERLLFRQRYDTPVHLDCEGGARPGLASSWIADSSGRSWTLLLRPDRSGVDGEPLTAGRLVTEWRSREAAWATLHWAGVTSVVPLDQQRLVLTFGRPQESVPEVLADPALGIAAASPGTPTISVSLTRDLRDALDRGADLIQSGDPELIEYARSRADHIAVSLPWAKTYVLLLPAGSNGLEPVIGTDSAAFRSSLARDAVHADARGAEPPFWWADTALCSRPAPANVPAAQPSGVLVYSRDDRIARDLAERIVALAAVPEITARGVSADDLAASLEVGRERGYILALPRRSAVPCREVASRPAGARVVPLVDGRLTAILRRGLPSITTEWDGTLRIGDDIRGVTRP